MSDLPPTTYIPNIDASNVTVTSTSEDPVTGETVVAVNGVEVSRTPPTPEQSAAKKQREALEKADAMATVAALTAKPLIESDTLDEATLTSLSALYEPWKAGEAVAVGDIRSYGTDIVQVIQAHTTQVGWEPPAVPALWKTYRAPGGVTAWVQPLGAEDAYMIGDRVTYNGHTYESLIDVNVWSPDAYPAGWSQVD